MALDLDEVLAGYTTNNIGPGKELQCSYAADSCSRPWQLDLKMAWILRSAQGAF